MANQKLRALLGISNLTILNQQKKIMNIFINYLFSYCPLILMLNSKSRNKRIDRIHKISLRLIHNDYISSFYDMLSTYQNNSPTLHKHLITKVSTASPELIIEV